MELEKKESKGVKLFLDDIRQPKDCLGYMYQRIGKDNFLYLEEWLVVKNFEEFKAAVEKHIDEITHISYDHDLSDDHYQVDKMDSVEEYNELYATFKEKTGLDCAKWMKEFYKSHNKPWPVMFVHSYNPVGIQNIINVFK